MDFSQNLSSNHVNHGNLMCCLFLLIITLLTIEDYLQLFVFVLLTLPHGNPGNLSLAYLT